MLPLLGTEVEGDEPGDKPPGLVLGVLLPGLPAPGAPLPGLSAPDELLPGLPAPGEVSPGLPVLPLLGTEVEGDEPGDKPPGLVLGVLLPGLPAPGEVPPGLAGLPLLGVEVEGDEPGDEPGAPPELPGTELVVVELGAEPPELDARPPANAAPGGAVVKVPAPVARTPLLLLTV